MQLNEAELSFLKGAKRKGFLYKSWWILSRIAMFFMIVLALMVAGSLLLKGDFSSYIQYGILAILYVLTVKLCSYSTDIPLPLSAVAVGLMVSGPFFHAHPFTNVIGWLIVGFQLVSLYDTSSDQFKYE